MVDGLRAGFICRYAMAILLAVPLSVGLVMLASLAWGYLPIVDGETRAYFIVFLCLGLPGVLVATALGSVSRNKLADFGSATAATISVFAAGGIAVIGLVAALWLVGLGTDYSLDLLLLPFSQGVIATTILAALTRRRDKRTMTNG